MHAGLGARAAAIDAPLGTSGAAAAAAAAGPAAATGRKRAPKYAPKSVLVRFRSAPAAAALAAAQARAPVVPGLHLDSLVGEHHQRVVPSGPAAAAAATAAAPLPAGAVMRFRITDGSSVEAKVKQLRANPGGSVVGSGGRRWAVRTTRQTADTVHH